MSLKKLVAEDAEVAAFRVKVDLAMQALSPRLLGARRRELHASDFTASDSEFCARKVVVRWWRGERQEFTTKVQHDGKFREQKWLAMFEAAGVVRAYQPEYRLGLLVGHPDFVLDWGFGEAIVDLTGFDPTNDPIFRGRHLAGKKRQVRLYVVMADARRGFVIYEDKARVEYKVVPVDRDAAEERRLVGRVAVVSAAVQALGDDPDEAALLEAVSRLSRCELASCRWCHKVNGASSEHLVYVVEVSE